MLDQIDLHAITSSASERQLVTDIITVKELERTGAAPRLMIGEALRLELRAWALDVDGLPARAPGPSELVARLALEEGELLALRAPDRAARLLELAAERYQLGGNAGGWFVASVCWAIALVHDGRSDSAAKVVDHHIRVSYERLAGQASLPPWDELDGSLRSADNATASRPQPWDGWIARLRVLRGSSRGVRRSSPIYPPAHPSNSTSRSGVP